MIDLRKKLSKAQFPKTLTELECKIDELPQAWRPPARTPASTG